MHENVKGIIQKTWYKKCFNNSKIKHQLIFEMETCPFKAVAL